MPAPPFNRSHPCCTNRLCYNFQRPTPRLHASQSDHPWNIAHQINARHLAWNDGATARLITLSLQEKLDLSEEEVEKRMRELSALLPDLQARLTATKVSILLDLIQDLPELALKLMKLKEALPGLNLSALIARHPQILSDWTPEQVEERVIEMRGQAPGLDVIALIDKEPHFLKVDLRRVIADMTRLLPNSDPIKVLAANPELALPMNEAGMESALDVEGYVPRPRSS